MHKNFGISPLNNLPSPGIQWKQLQRKPQSQEYDVEQLQIDVLYLTDLGRETGSQLGG